MNLRLNKIHCIDVLKGLKKLPDDSIDCIVTSPPYWALRDYKEKGQIGLEDHPQDYINKIIEVMKECKRVIKPTGSIWLNLGDSFYSGTGNEKANEFLPNHKLPKNIRGKFKSNWLQHKQKLLIPFRIAIKCQDELGLILRNNITWIWKIEVVTCSQKTEPETNLVGETKGFRLSAPKKLPKANYCL